MMRRTAWIFGAVAAASCALAGSTAAQEHRGATLAQIMDRGGCHTPGAMAGKPDRARTLGGGDVGFEFPNLGILYPPNLTRDATGAGSWSAAEIIRAVTEGIRPDGRRLIPSCPTIPIPP